jgi:phosphatidylinositol alpha-1,6-mannosyltransferase
MGALADHYPEHGLITVTGRIAGSEAADAERRNRVVRIPVSARRLRTLPGLLRWSRRVSVLARRQKAGFIWCGNLKPAAYPARWTTERTGIPYGVILYGGDLLTLQHQIHRSALKWRAARALVGSAAVLVTISDYTRELTESVLSELNLPCTPGRVRVVPLGTDPVFFRPGLDTAGVRQRYALPADGRWLMTVARLVRHKGIDTVLRAMALLADTAPDLRYAVVGAGERLDELRALAAELGVADRVHFLTDVPDADLPALYNVADVYVQVSRRAENGVEGFGIAIVEASACGVPVVAGRSGGMPDAVREGATGVLVDSESDAAVAAAVRRLLEEPGHARMLGAGGRSAVESFYNWDRVTRDLIAIANDYAASVSPSSGIAGAR